MMDTTKDNSLCGLIKFHSARLAEVAKDTEKLQATIDSQVAEAYKKGFEDGKAQSERECNGCLYDDGTKEDSPCDVCCNAYEEKQKAENEIKVGDEVNWLGDCFIVTRIFQPHNMKEQCDGIDDDGCVYRDILMDDLEKTGRHFDIASILEDMRHD